jgi:hypothetical protein
VIAAVRLSSTCAPAQPSPRRIQLDDTGVLRTGPPVDEPVPGQLAEERAHVVGLHVQRRADSRTLMPGWVPMRRSTSTCASGRRLSPVGGHCRWRRVRCKVQTRRINSSGSCCGTGTLTSLSNAEEHQANEQDRAAAPRTAASRASSCTPTYDPDVTSPAQRMRQDLQQPRVQYEPGQPAMDAEGFGGRTNTGECVGSCPKGRSRASSTSTANSSAPPSRNSLSKTCRIFDRSPAKSGRRPATVIAASR